MPENSFVALRKAIVAEYATHDRKLTASKAKRIAGRAMKDAAFQRAMSEIDAADMARGLDDLNPYSDTTARRAIQQVLYDLFGEAWDTGLVAA